MGVRRTFGAVFWLVAALLVVSATILTSATMDELKRSDAMTWPTVQGKIVLSSYGDAKSSKGPSYWPQIYYDFRLNGQDFKSCSVQFGPKVVGSKNEIETLVSRYPVGKEVIVHYNPKMPSESVLDPSARPSGSYWQMGLGFGFLIMALLIIGLRFIGAIY